MKGELCGRVRRGILSSGTSIRFGRATPRSIVSSATAIRSEYGYGVVTLHVMYNEDSIYEGKSKMKKQEKGEQFRLRLRGCWMVLIDWANVYRWADSVGSEMDAGKIKRFLESYPEIIEQRLYFGKDNNEKSSQFLHQMSELGYRVISKPVKYLRTLTETGEYVAQRKCDFDLEIGLDCWENLDRFDGFIIFSGDGDFATLYSRLLAIGKRVIVVFAPDHLGKEVWALKGKRGLYLCSVGLLEVKGKNIPRTRKSRGVIKSSLAKKRRKSR